MAIVAGIDEAGYGPVLGPLVVSAVAFKIPDEQADASLWKLLRGTVTKKPSRRPASLAIGDSKQLYSGLRAKRGLADLERGVLAMLRTGGRSPATLGELLAVVAPQAADRAADYPWYAAQELPLPHSVGPTDLSLISNALSVAMRRVGLSLEMIRCEVLFEGEFNRVVQVTRNKSTMLFDTTCRLLDELWRRYAARGLCIHADHQGGRINYLPGLQRAFDGCRFKVIDQTPTRSAYQMADGERRAEVRFAVGAERVHLAAALASMVSKYVRELLMAVFNRFWAQQVPGVAPTAGYYTDGKRFYGDILQAVRRLGIDKQMLYRTR